MKDYPFSGAEDSVLVVLSSWVMSWSVARWLLPKVMVRRPLSPDSLLRESCKTQRMKMFTLPWGLECSERNLITLYSFSLTNSETHSFKVLKDQNPMVSRADLSLQAPRTTLPPLSLASGFTGNLCASLNQSCTILSLLLLSQASL